MPGTYTPNPEAPSVFCATACIARPVTVLARKAWVDKTKTIAKAKVPTSVAQIVTPAMLYTSSANK